MIKKISLGVFYAFIGASLLELLNTTFFKNVDWSMLTDDLSFKRIVIIAISGFFIGAFISGIIEKEEMPIELRSKRAGYFILLGTVIAFLCSVFFF